MIINANKINFSVENDKKQYQGKRLMYLNKIFAYLERKNAS